MDEQGWVFPKMNDYRKNQKKPRMVRKYSPTSADTGKLVKMQDGKIYVVDKNGSLRRQKGMQPIKKELVK